MERIIVEASLRESRGKNAARRLRVAGQIPAVLYGGKGTSQALEVNAKQVTAILRSASGHNTIFNIKTKDSEETAIVKDWLVDPVKGNLLHVDLLRIAMDVRMRVSVPVHTFGEPQGVKVQGGVFEVVTREVDIECLPSEIPTEFRIDVTPLMMGMQLRASDIPLAPGVKLITDPTRVLAHVVALRVEEEKPAEVAATEAATAAEPELIKKGKKETEEGEEGEEAAAPEKEKKK